VIGKLPVLFLAILALFLGRPAQALTLGDAALTVSVSTVSGAILGASTLPFYEDSGKHTKNIFYGAAIGAVVGVLISAYAGVKESQDDDEAFLRVRAPADARFAFSRELKPELSSSLKKGAPMGSALVWSPVARLNF
jgi:hypothetical protein